MSLAMDFHQGAKLAYSSATNLKCLLFRQSWPNAKSV